jgi:hypothetical protein
MVPVRRITPALRGPRITGAKIVRRSFNEGGPVRRSFSEGGLARRSLGEGGAHAQGNGNIATAVAIALVVHAQSTDYTGDLRRLFPHEKSQKILEVLSKIGS